MTETYRACYARYPGGGTVVLTLPEHQHLSDADFRAEADAEAARALRPDERIGETLEIGDWTDR